MKSTLLVVTILFLAGCAEPPAATSPAPPAPPPPRHAHLACAVDGVIYLIGGIGNAGDHACIARVDRYDTRTGQWSAAASSPTPRAFAGAAVLDGRIHVVGGLSDEDIARTRSSTIHERYDPATDTWSALAPLPTARSRLSLVGVGERLYAIGGMEIGNGEHRDSAIVEVYDPVSDSWRRGSDLPAGRHAHAACAVNDRVYILGGYSLRQTLEPLASVEVLDTASGTWSPGPAMTTPRSWFSVVLVDGCLIAVGGGDTLERLCQPWDRWTPTDVPGVADRRFAAVGVGNVIYITGGEGSESPLRVITVK